MNCWWFNFTVQEVRQQCILMWQHLVYVETHSTAVSPAPFPRAGAAQWWLYWMKMESSHHTFHGSENKLFFLPLFHLLQVSSIERRDKITQHKLRERRRRLRWKSSWCSPACSPLLARALLAEGLRAFYLSAASELAVLWVTWQSYSHGQCLSVTVSWSYRKAAIAFPLPAGSWTLRRWGWEKNTSGKGWKISFRRNTNYLNVCRTKWSISFKID